MDNRESLKEDVTREITRMFHNILKDAELATPNNWTYKRFRHRVLDHGNDTIRLLHERIDIYKIEKDYSLAVETLDIEEV